MCCLQFILPQKWLNFEKSYMSLKPRKTSTEWLIFRPDWTKISLLYLYSFFVCLFFCTKLRLWSQKAMAPHSSTLACKIPWAEEPGGLLSMGWLRVGLVWVTSLSLFTFMHWRRKWQPTPVFLPGESRDGGAWWAAVYGVQQSRTRLKRLSSSSSRDSGKIFGNAKKD